MNCKSPHSWKRGEYLNLNAVRNNAQKHSYKFPRSSAFTMHVDLFRLVVFCPLVLLSYFVLWRNVVPQMHCSGLAWHPDVATQMVLASEDDRLPVIQMWDLRFASSPLRVLESHTRYESFVTCCSVVFMLLVIAFHQFVCLTS